MNNYQRRPLVPQVGSQLRAVPETAPPGSPGDLDRTRDLVARFTQNRKPALALRQPDEWREYFRALGLADSVEIAALAKKFLALLAAQVRVLRTASGAYGKVLILDNTPATRAVLDRLKDKALAAGNFVGGEPRMASRALAVKVQPLYRSRSSLTIEERLREDAVHAYLTLAGCRTGPDGARWCARDAVPALHWAGYLPTANVQLSVMELVEGPDLYDAAASLTRAGLRGLHAALETATFTLWAFGIFHGDLHEGNAIVQPDGRIKIIDFGFAVALDELRLDGPPLPLATMRSAGLHGRLELLADAAMRARLYPAYNPNTQSLRHFWESARPTTPDAPVAAGGGGGWSFRSAHLNAAAAAGPAGALAGELVLAASTLVAGAREDAMAGRSGRMEHVVEAPPDGEDYGRVTSAIAADGSWTVRVLAFSGGNGPHRAELTLTGRGNSLRVTVAPGSVPVDLARAVVAGLRAGRVVGPKIRSGQKWCLEGTGPGEGNC